MRRVAALLSGVLLGGCALIGGIPADEVPGAPLAIHYRDREQARKHAEALAAGAKAPAAIGGPRVVGSKAHLRADLDTLGGFLSEALDLRPPVPPPERGRLALLDPRSGEVEVVESARPGAVPLAWSPDRGRLLFAQPVAPESRDVQIYEWDRAGRTVRPVTFAPPVHTEACYGPLGRIVATAVGGEGAERRSWIRISDTGGRGPWRDLTEGPADHAPTCAPDGSLLLFVRTGESGRGEIRAVDAPFDAPSRRLAPGIQPRFAGRGGWIVYVAAHGRSSRLARIRADGSGRTPIGRDENAPSWPAPSPDGRYVAFLTSEDVGEDAPRRRLVLRRFDGSGSRVLLRSGQAAHPVW